MAPRLRAAMKAMKAASASMAMKAPRKAQSQKEKSAAPALKVPVKTPSKLTEAGEKFAARREKKTKKEDKAKRGRKAQPEGSGAPSLFRVRRREQKVVC